MASYANKLMLAMVPFLNVLGDPPEQKQVKCRDDFAIISSLNATYSNMSDYPQCYSYDHNPCPSTALKEDDIKKCRINGDYPGYHALSISLPGHHRDECFLEACCQCGGGRKSKSDEVCYDQDVGVADREGYSCKHYNSGKVSCTVERVDSNFNPMDLCCKCGGGKKKPASVGLRGRLELLQHVEWFMHTLVTMSWLVLRLLLVWSVSAFLLTPLIFRFLEPVSPVIVDCWIIITTSYGGSIYLFHILTLPLLGCPLESERGKEESEKGCETSPQLESERGKEESEKGSETSPQLESERGKEESEKGSETGPQLESERGKEESEKGNETSPQIRLRDRLLFPKFPHFGPLPGLQATKETTLKGLFKFLRLLVKETYLEDLFEFFELLFTNLFNWSGVTMDETKDQEDQAHRQDSYDRKLWDMVAVYSVRLLRNFLPLSVLPYGVLLGFMGIISSAVVLLACIIMEGALLGMATGAHVIATMTVAKPHRGDAIVAADEGEPTPSCLESLWIRWNTCWRAEDAPRAEPKQTWKCISEIPARTMEFLMDWMLPDMSVALKVMLTFFFDFLLLFSLMMEMAYFFPKLPLPSFDIDFLTINVAVPGWLLAVFEWFIKLYSWFQLPEVVYRCVSLSALSAAFYLYFAALSISVILSSDIISCVYDRQNRFESRSGEQTDEDDALKPSISVQRILAKVGMASTDSQVGAVTQRQPAEPQSAGTRMSSTEKRLGGADLEVGAVTQKDSRQSLNSEADAPSRQSSSLRNVAAKVQEQFSLKSFVFSAKKTICTNSTYVIWQVVTLVANSFCTYILFTWQRVSQPKEQKSSLSYKVLSYSFVADQDECTEGMHNLAWFLFLYLAVCTVCLGLRVFTGHVYENDAWILTAAMVQTERKLTWENLWRFAALMRLSFWTYLFPFASLGLTTTHMKNMRDFFYEEIKDKEVQNKYENDECWKLSEAGLKKLVDLTLAKGKEFKDEEVAKEVINQVLHKTPTTTTSGTVSKAAVEAIGQWKDLFSGRREIVDSLIGLFIDDDAADKAAEVIRKRHQEEGHQGLLKADWLHHEVRKDIRTKIQNRHRTDIFNAEAIDDFSLHFFLGAYVRSQRRRQDQRWPGRLADMLTHLLLMPVGVMKNSQIATAHVEERCIMWRAQIEQVTKATGATFGIIVFAIPLVGPILGKIIHYLNEHPVLIFIPKGAKAADCSLRGGDASQKPESLEKRWKAMQEEKEGADKEEKRRVLVQEIMKSNDDVFTAQVHLKERVVKPEWRQIAVYVCSVIKAAMLVVAVFMPGLALFCTLCVFPIAWMQSYFVRWENDEWEKRFQHDHNVVEENNSWKEKTGLELVDTDLLGIVKV